jgi:iron complex transport system ATP-binding protein
MTNLKLEHVNLGYNHKTVLSDVNLECYPGEILGIIGPNGSGKSTLVRGLSRLLSPSRGRISLDDQNVAHIKHEELARIIAVVPQNTTMPETFSALEIVMMGRTPHLGFFRFESSRDYDIVNQAMESTSTSHLASLRVSEISGGERQRLLIARALAQETEILVLDEPTAYLDINYQIETLTLVKRLCRERGLMVITALHDLNLAVQYCDRLALLNRGTIFSQGKPADVINAKTIKEVYGADVLVYPHPINKLPATLITGNGNGNHHNIDNSKQDKSKISAS